MSRHGKHDSNFRKYVWIFILINYVGFSISSNDDCLFNSENLFSFNSSTCDGGEWGGFLNKNCSTGAFCDYLYLMGIRANQTGNIFLNSTELSKCVTRINEADVMVCGMEKLKAGGGGCSDFSIQDVNNRLGDKLERLRGKCEMSPANEWDKSCAACLKSWEEIKKMNSDSDDRLMNADSGVCSFAVLISLTSSNIRDKTWVLNVYSCLGKQQDNKDFEADKHVENKRMGKGFCILIGGIIGLLMIVITSAVWIFSGKRKTSITPLEKDEWRPASSKFPAWKSALSEMSKDSLILRIPVEEVYTATKNLQESNLIGQGTAGKVYRGVLSNNQHVAIKHIRGDGCAETFLREIRSLMHVRHPNLVGLEGYSENESECFLIYELYPNGNLSQWLYGNDKFLSWIQRLEIAIGSARGLSFLHTFPRGCIVHRDVKPTNILLGTNFEAKLSDFGLSKVMNFGESYVSSEVRGTFGYVDPEYQSNSQVSAAGDIYSLGIVLLQIISGRKVINMNMKKPLPLHKIAKTLLKNGSMAEFADPKLNGEYPIEAFLIIFELALLCTSLKQQRPSIGQVIVKLEEALDISMRRKAFTPHNTPDRTLVPSSWDVFQEI